MMALVVFFLVQTLYGELFFSIFFGPNVKWTFIVNDLFMEEGGIYSIPITVSATYVVLFILFGVLFITGNPPVHPKFKELATTTDIDVLDIGEEGLDRVFAKYPFLSPITLPKNIYRGVEAGFKTIGGNVLLMARRSLSDEAAYTIVKTFYDNLDAIKGGPADARGEYAGGRPGREPDRRPSGSREVLQGKGVDVGREATGSISSA